MISAFRTKFSAFTPLFKANAFKTLQLKASATYASKEIAKGTKKEQEVNPRSYQSLKAHNWLVYDPKHLSSAVTHKSVSEQYIARIPVIQVHENVVRCIGGTKPGAGHPQVYIQLNTRDQSKPSVCPYCGLRFQKVSDHHDHHH